MSKFPVQSAKALALKAEMDRLGIFEEQLIERFVRSSGPGGQKVNKTSSCVYLLHEPSGLEVKCQKTRSQALNRYYARQLLCEKIKDLSELEQSKAEKAREKIRRQKQRRSRKQKAKMLENKAHRAKTKSTRRPVPTDSD